MNKEENTECPECGELTVTTVFNGIDTWIATCNNEDCGLIEQYP